MTSITSVGIDNISFLYICVPNLFIMKVLFSCIFLLFLTTTSYCQEWLDNSCPIDQQVYSKDYSSAESKNLLSIIIDQEGSLLINGDKNEGLSEIQFKEMVYDFLTNPSKDKNKADSPKKAIIALGSYGEHEYYDLVLRYIREVYLYAWDVSAKEKYNSDYINLNCKKRSRVQKEKFTYNVIELNNTKENTKKKIPSGVPTFNGNVYDN